MKIDLETVLEQGSKYLTTTHPDNIAKRTALAQVLVSSLLCRDLESAVVAFKFWANRDQTPLTAEQAIEYANRYTRERYKVDL